MPDRVSGPSRSSTPRKTPRKHQPIVTVISDDDDSEYADSGERPRSAAEKRQDAEYGRLHAKHVQRGQTPTRRRSSLRNNNVKFTGTGAPATPTLNRARDPTPGPDLRSPYQSPYVEDVEKDDETGGVNLPVGGEPDPGIVDQEEDEDTVPVNPFAGMTPAKIKIITSAMSEAQLEEFVGTPVPRTRRSLAGEFRASATLRTDAEDARQRNAGFLNNLSTSVHKRKRDEETSMFNMSGSLGTPPATGGRQQGATPPSTPNNDPRSELEILRAILASQNETIRLQNLRNSRNSS